jgi:hypothetical protein
MVFVPRPVTTPSIAPAAGFSRWNEWTSSLELAARQFFIERLQTSHVVPQQEGEAPMNVAVLFHPVIIGCLVLAVASLIF